MVAGPLAIISPQQVRDAQPATFVPTPPAVPRVFVFLFGSPMRAPMVLGLRLGFAWLTTPPAALTRARAGAGGHSLPPTASVLLTTSGIGGVRGVGGCRIPHRRACRRPARGGIRRTRRTGRVVYRGGRIIIRISGRGGVAGGRISAGSIVGVAEAGLVETSLVRVRGMPATAVAAPIIMNRAGVVRALL